MKLFAGIAFSVMILIGSETITRPDPFFTPGNRIIYESWTFPKKGKSYSVQEIIQVEKVKTAGTQVTSECLMGFYYTNRGPGFYNPSYRMWFGADSLNFYAFTKNWCYVPIHEEEYITYEVSGDSLIYPFGMKVGDTLQSAQASSKYSIYKTKIAYTVTFSDRVVESIDTVSTSFGKIPAFRITMNSKYNVQSYETETGDGGRHLVDEKITEWFSQSYGIIKLKYEAADGAYSSEMISYNSK